MSSTSRRRRIVPVALGIAMLAVAVVAALTPNTGVVQAQTNAQYNQPTSSSLSPYVYVGIGAAVAIAALLVALLLLGRRRRGPPPPPPPPMQAWEGGGPQVPPAVGGAPPAPPPPPGALTPAYLETPEDVGQATPTVPLSRAGAAAGTGAAAGAAAGTAGAETEPDIDSLMAELDKISGEILKRAPKRAPTTGVGGEGDDGLGP